MMAVNWLLIVAVLLGPIVAVAFYRQLDRQRESYDRKLTVFRALMATRAHSSSWEHIDALSRIDIEFDTDIEAEAAVLEAWKQYVQSNADSQLPAADWVEQRSTHLVDLLEKMAAVVGHQFDREHVEKSTAMRLPVMSSRSSR